MGHFPIAALHISQTHNLLTSWLPIQLFPKMTVNRNYKSPIPSSNLSQSWIGFLVDKHRRRKPKIWLHLDTFFHHAFYSWRLRELIYDASSMCMYHHQWLYPILGCPNLGCFLNAQTWWVFNARFALCLFPPFLSWLLFLPMNHEVIPSLPLFKLMSIQFNIVQRC